METQPPSPLISSKRAAQILDVTARTVARWAGDGLIPAMKMEGKTGAYVFSPEAIENARRDGIVRADGRVLLHGQRREPVAS